MKRAQRRREGPVVPRSIRLLIEHYACPDCLSENSVPWHDGRMWHFAVLHDPTCPTLAAVERGHQY